MCGRRLLALDLGTTSVKAGLFAEDGTLLRLASAPTPTRHPAPGWAEHDADALWACACQVLREAADGQERPEALAIASVGEAGLLVDADGEALTPVIAWYDQRSVGYAAFWEETVGARRVYALTGLPLDGSYSASMLRWLQEHAGAVVEKARWWLSVADLVQLRLTGRVATVHSLASRTMLYDQHAGDWCDELLEPLGMARERFPEILESGAPIGTVTARAAGLTGIPAGTQVVGGGHDHICSALALRAGEERAVDSTGTAEVVVVPIELPQELDVERAGHIACYADVEPGRHILSARVGMAGALVEWARRTLYDGAPYERMVQELAGAARPSGILCLSTFGRASTPHFDPSSAVGTLVGLTTAHARGDVLLALLEGACCSLRANLERVEALGAPRSAELRAGGGAVRNPVWLQLKADVTGRAVVAVDVEESTLLGAALLACVGAGIDPDPAAAAGRIGLSGRRIEPNLERHAAYQPLYEGYLELGPAVAGAARASARFQNGRNR